MRFPTVRLFPLLLVLILIGCSRNAVSTDPLVLDDLKTEVFDQSRELGYTNKEAGFFYTESNAENVNGWQGWHIMSRKMLDDYRITVDVKPLLKSDVPLCIVEPHQFTRAYRVGVQETVTLLDSVDALVIELAKIRGDSVSLRPLFGDFDHEEDFSVHELKDGMLIARRSHLHRNGQADFPVWIGMGFVGTTESGERGNHDGRLFSPASVRTTVIDGKAVAVLVAGDTEEQTINLLRTVKSTYRLRIEARKKRMEQVLNRAFFRTNNARFDKALHWAMLSMDALIMNQGGKRGIFAGLPWFSNYWGRDSFISLPGATLVTGNFSDAKEILRSFARWQDTSHGSPTEGRIPNLVTPTSISYNTTDGTPWFTVALGDYVTMSGDTTFLREMFPVVSRSIEGALKNRIDKLGFMTHGDAETWMDAVGPEGPWSPRGNRANDIQALWYKQLLTGSWMAERIGDQKHFTEWFSYAEQLRKSFNDFFIDTTTGMIYDHLVRDGTPSRQVRPNQLFTLDLVQDTALQFKAFTSVTESLVYPFGVASLSQDDPNFHPYHHYPPFYVQDAAYHNGVVWTWLAGPWISAAAKFGYTTLAWQLTENMERQILDRGAVGTLSELLDAAPRNGEEEPRLSGTFSQAWSLAEFVRVAYQDYLGVNVDASERKIELHPSFPPSISDASFNITLGSETIYSEYHTSPTEGTITLESPASGRPIDIIVAWRLGEKTEQNFEYVLNPGTRATLTITRSEVSVDDNAGTRVTGMNVRRDVQDEAANHPLHFASPVVRTDLKALQGPDHRILNNEEIKTENSRATLLADETDPEGDDKGNGSYVYPLTSNLKAGSLDIRGLRVSADDRNLYFRLTFRNLSDPGWHPEYGFQLTYAAIAIDKDGKSGSGRVIVGRNANFLLPKRDACESMVFVGGGLRVEDAQGKVIAEYVPAPGDERHPLGNVASKTVSFALPVDVIGTPSAGWRYTVLVGAQDDHGGAGIGDFRSVGRTAQEWSGGGRQRASDPNVYDVLNPKP